MKDQDKNMQHALFSFALLGGLLVNPRNKGRLGSFFSLPRKPR